MKKTASINKLIRLAICLVLAVTVIYATVGRTIIDSHAEVSSNNAIRFKDAAGRIGGSIPVGTLLIGTHLIDMNGLTDQLYGMAQETMEDSGQQEIYYKSEFADGAWYNITNAGRLGDIYDDAIPVNESELRNLFVRYYTNERGITRDIKENREINIFEIKDIHNLYSLPEMKSLVSTYEGTLRRYASENGGPNLYIRQRVAYFFNINTFINEENSLHSQLSRLDSLYKNYANRGERELAESVYMVMEAVDASRRVAVYNYLLTEEPEPLDIRGMDRDSELKPLMDRIGYKWRGNGRSFDQDREYVSNMLYGAPPTNVDHLIINVTGSGYVSDWYEEKPWSNNYEVLDSITNTRNEMEEQRRIYEAKALPTGTDVRGKALEQALNEIRGWNGGSTPDGAVRRYRNIYNIINGQVVKSSEELAILESGINLINQSSDLAAAALRAGASSDYNAARSAGEHQAALKSRLKLQKAEGADANIAELQFLISEKIKRINTEDGVNYIYERLNETDTWERSVRDDAFKPYAMQSIEAHRRWLKQLALDLKGSDDDLDSKEDDLEARKQALILERDKALDDENLDLAERLDQEIADINKEIADNLAGVLDDINGSGSTGDRARGEGNLGNDSLEGLINKVKGDVLDSLSGDGGGLDGNTTIDDGTGNGSGNGTGDGSGDGTGNGSGDGTGDGSGNGGNGDGGGDGATGKDVASMSPAGAENGIALLAELGATDALKEIKDKMAAMGASAGDLALLDGALKTAEANADGMGIGVPSTTGYLSEDDMRGIIEDILGMNIYDLDSAGKLVAAVACHEFSEIFDPAEFLALKLMNLCIDENNPYIYPIVSSGTRYSSMPAVGKASGHRYEHRGFEHSLSRSAVFYTFLPGEKTVSIKNEGSRDLSREINVVVSGSGELAYLSEPDTSSLFNCDTEYIESSGYGGCLNQGMVSQKEDIISALKDALGEGAGTEESGIEETDIEETD